MVEDFEWKIHEIEADFHRKLKEAVAEAALTGAETLAPPTTSSSSSSKAVSEAEVERRIQRAKLEVRQGVKEQPLALQLNLLHFIVGPAAEGRGGCEAERPAPEGDG